MLTVMVIQHVVSPTLDRGTDQVLGNVEIQRDQRVITQHQALGFFHVEFSPTRVRLLLRTVHQAVEFLARVAGHVRRIIGLERAKKGVRVVVVAVPVEPKHLDLIVFLLHVREQHLEVFVDGFRFDTEHTEPRSLDGRGNLAVGLVRVVSDLRS